MLCVQWVVVIAASSRFIVTGSPDDCPRALQYQVYVLVLLVCFVLACALEIWGIREGLKGVRVLAH